MTPQHFFESDAHQREFAEQLRSGRTASKFMYAGSAVALHQRLATERAGDYLRGRAETELRVLIDGVNARLPEQICDIGTSNGIHTMQFTRMYRKYVPHLRWMAIDFSTRMLNEPRLRASADEAPQRVCVWDVEAGVTSAISSWRGEGRILNCLLGNTVANWQEPTQGLSNLARSARRSDLLLMSAYLYSPVEVSTSIEYYGITLVQDLMKEPFRAAGFEDSEMRVDFRWDGSAIIGEVELVKSRTALGVTCDEGSRIQCFTSHRYRMHELLSALLESGWIPVYREEAGSCGIVVANRA